MVITEQYIETHAPAHVAEVACVHIYHSADTCQPPLGGSSARIPSD